MTNLKQAINKFSSVDAQSLFVLKADSKNP